MENLDVEDLSGRTEIACGTDGVRDGLAAITKLLDGHFNRAGQGLGQTVETIDVILASLQEVTQVFGQGEAHMAVTTLTETATRLTSVAASVGERNDEVARIQDVSRSLRRNVAEIQRCLRVLQIYAMNVKIAASGAPDFVEFADQMNGKLSTGSRQAEDFETKLAELDTSIARMQAIDLRLMSECRKVIPHVPNRLTRDAQSLREHQSSLADLAQTTGAHARAIQAELGSALTAIQVGDRTRQRLEHVDTACVLLEAHAPHTNEGSRTSSLTAAQRGHVLALLQAQVRQAGEEYGQEVHALAFSLARLRGSAEALSALQERDGQDNEAGALFLRRMEDAIAEAAEMIAHLHRADIQAEETLGVIVHTVEAVSLRVAEIRNLRIDVRQMAINIGLRCRKTEVIGRPVSVIANEIRSHSDKLDTLIAEINAAEANLIAVSERMRAQATGRDAVANTDLSRALETIRDCAQTTDMAMATVEQGSIGMMELLQQTIVELDAAVALEHPIAEVVEDLVPSVVPSGPEPVSDPEPETDTAALENLLRNIAETYTMAGERQIHDRFLLPGMAPTSGGTRPTETAGEEYDGFDDFDDGLF